MAIQLYNRQLGLPTAPAAVRLDASLAGTSALTGLGQVAGLGADFAAAKAAEGFEKLNTAYVSEQRASIARAVVEHRIQAEREAPEGAPDFVPAQDRWLQDYRSQVMADAEAQRAAGAITSDAIDMLGSHFDQIGTQNFAWAAQFQDAAQTAQLGARLNRSMLNYAEAIRTNPAAEERIRQQWQTDLDAAAATWMRPDMASRMAMEAEQLFTESMYLGWVSTDPEGFLAAHTQDVPVDDGTVTMDQLPDRDAATGASQVDVGQAVYNRAVEVFGERAVSLAAQLAGMPGQDGNDPIEFVRQLAETLDNAGERSDADTAALRELRDMAMGTSPAAPAPAEGGVPAPVPTRTERLVIPGVSPSFANSLFAQAQGAVDDALAVQQYGLQTRIADELVALEQGLPVRTPVTDAEIMAAWRNEPQRAAAIRDGLVEARGIAEQQRALQDLSNVEITTLIESERAALQASGEVDAGDRVARFEALRQAGDALLTARRADPAGWTYQHSPAVRAAFDQAAQSGDGEDWATAIGLSMRRQDDFVDRADDRRPLPAQLATQLMTAYRDTPTAQRLALLQQVTTGLNDDAAGRQVLDQLEAAGLDRGMRIVLEASRHIAPGAAEDLTRWMLGSEDQQARFEQRFPNETDRRSAVQTALAAYDTQRGWVYDQRSAIVGGDDWSLQQVLSEREAFARMVVGHALTNGLEVADSASAVMGLAFGYEKPIDEDLGYAFVPAAGAQAALTVEGMDAVREFLPRTMPLAELVPYLGIPPDQADAIIARDSWEDLAPQARWVNYGEGYALAMPVAVGRMGRLLVDATGEVRTWTAAQLAETGAAVMRVRGEDVPEDPAPAGEAAPIGAYDVVPDRGAWPEPGDTALQTGPADEPLSDDPRIREMQLRERAFMESMGLRP